MFTGLIEEIGSIENIKRSGNGFEITVRADTVMAGLNVGDSIAIDGACQTVTSFDERSFTVFASQVTASITTLAGKLRGDRVNLERAVEAGKRFGGHIVQGHVDGIGKIISLTGDVKGLSITISADSHLLRHIVGKGSVAVNGVSLTVVSENGNSFELYLIPETVDRTTLTSLKAGDSVNIETDILAKYCEKLLSGERDGSLMRALGENGYL